MDNVQRRPIVLLSNKKTRKCINGKYHRLFSPSSSLSFANTWVCLCSITKVYWIRYFALPYKKTTTRKISLSELQDVHRHTKFSLALSPTGEHCSRDFNIFTMLWHQVVYWHIQMWETIFHLLVQDVSYARKIHDRVREFHCVSIDVAELQSSFLFGRHSIEVVFEHSIMDKQIID